MQKFDPNQFSLAQISIFGQSSRTVFMQLFMMTVFVVLLVGCSSASKKELSWQQDFVSTKSGGFYLDDGPGVNPPADLNAIPDAVPRIETLRKANMRPYVALGKPYQPMHTLGIYKEQGIASWYGRRYHGRQTASGEIYDMYAMTAAHPTLPLPSYARVTNLNNAKTIVVKINDRGPFLANRVIDLSYTAAYKLGILASGSAAVEVESIVPSVTPIKQSVNLLSVPDAATNTNTIYLQLGAFGTADNAHNFLAYIQTEFPWLIMLLGVTEQGGLYKIQAGPFINLILAKQAADEITQQLAIKPILLVK